ncbi:MULTISPECIES: helix-turn-helix domain-containing protein [Bacillus cereus group]|uniref:helix-turn-helix domain-containing protein n=1 Tax=Bacillus cereus group TaxID=86661 RepID=UPI00066078E5|nr:MULTISPECIES: helix-turn-helix domain-containing protein [Bacillus cereus group]AWC29107.1 XRE family transcriptional regulator [Bacillus cytotoxicus]AWC33098.1 XRE family transcriptional regulator [Bacillus cytotoxicus]AWC37125.1 XRE family transcriptional regulator [Bacillus cytotoxicus]AWC39507.1 XRE family transcriptional regulator [Bacillus cytotoxicus]AWC47438.1 XRE family transcriptional regulator [Bacillus cytotoxicus]
MIDYTPLHVTLKEKDMVISDLRDKVLHSKTIARINRGMSVHLSTVEAICLHLDVPIEKVVKIAATEE